jgi:hypothetical protein
VHLRCANVRLCIGQQLTAQQRRCFEHELRAALRARPAYLSTARPRQELLGAAGGVAWPAPGAEAGAEGLGGIASGAGAGVGEGAGVAGVVVPAAPPLAGAGGSFRWQPAMARDASAASTAREAKRWCKRRCKGWLNMGSPEVQGI